MNKTRPSRAKRRTATPAATATEAIVPVDTPAEVPATPATAPAAADRIDVGGACTLKEAPALRALCMEALAGRVPPVIDGSAVERVDTAGIQVLVAFAIDCMERSIDFSWAGRSPALLRGIRLMGVEALLDSPGLAAVPSMRVP